MLLNFEVFIRITVSKRGSRRKKKKNRKNAENLRNDHMQLNVSGGKLTKNWLSAAYIEEEDEKS